MIDYRIYVRQAQDAIEEYGLDDSNTGKQDAFVALYDKQHRKLVLESSNGEQAKFDLTGSVLSEVDSFLKTKAISRWGRQAANMIIASTRQRRQKEN